MDAKSAMAYCQRVHDLRQCPVQVGSPQTETQREQVVRVIGALTQHRQQQQQQQQHVSRHVLAVNAAHEDPSRASPGKEPAPTLTAAGAAAAAQAAPSSAAQVPPEMMVATPPSTPPASAGRQRSGRLLLHAGAATAAATAASGSPGEGAPAVATPAAAVAVTAAASPQDVPPTASSTSLPVLVPTAAAATSAGPPPDAVPGEANAAAAAPAAAIKTPDPAPSVAAVGRQGSGITMLGAAGRQSSMGGGRRLSNTSAEWLNSLPPQLTETAGAKPPQGPFPFQRMPTEKMSREMLSSAPSSAEGRQRRGSKLVQAPQAAGDAMEVTTGAEIAPPTGPPPRRPSNGSIALLGGRRHSKGVPVVVSHGEDSSPKSPHQSSDGHTTPSDQFSDIEEGVVGHHVQLQKHAPSAPAAAHTHGSTAHGSAAPAAAVPAEPEGGVPMDIDTESSSNSARAAVPVSAPAEQPKRSSGTSTFLGFNFRRTSLNS
jgi:hypothetical protein